MLDEVWALSPSVALRPEPFGALAYHFGNRRLTFLKTLQLVKVVRGLDGRSTVSAALASSGVPRHDWPAYVAALEGLAGSDMIARCADEGAVR